MTKYRLKQESERGRVMSDLIHIRPDTDMDISSERVLSGAITDPPLDTVVVIGKTQEGCLYLASSTGDFGEITHLMKRAERHIDRLFCLEFE